MAKANLNQAFEVGSLAGAAERSSRGSNSPVQPGRADLVRSGNTIHGKTIIKVVDKIGVGSLSLRRILTACLPYLSLPNTNCINTRSLHFTRTTGNLNSSNAGILSSKLL